MFLKVLIASCLGGVLELDKTAVGQTMISQPIVAAPIVGLVLHDVNTGLIVGALLELIWIGTLPVGAFIPPDATLSAILATIIAVIVGESVGGVTSELIVFSIIFAIPFAVIGQRVDVFVRKLNGKLAEYAEETIDNDKRDKIDFYNLSGACFFFLKAFILVLAVSLIGIPIVANIIPLFSSEIASSLQLVYKLLPILGIGVVLKFISFNKNMLYLFVVVFSMTMLLEKLF